MRLPATLFCCCLLFIAQAQDGFIRAGNLQVHYRKEGHGRSLLMLHAGFQEMSMWDKQVAYFNPNYTVVRIDLPGHGATTGTDTTLLVQEVIRIVLDSLHIGKASVMGLSLGAACATDFALAYPERVNKLVLVSSGLSGWSDVLVLDSISRKRFELQDSTIGSGSPQVAADTFTQTWVAGPFRAMNKVDTSVTGYVMRTTLYTLQQHHSFTDWPRFNQQGMAKRMHQLQVPLLLAAGEKDLPFILSETHWMHHAVNGSKEIIFPGVAHMLNMETPGRLNRAVGAFLQHRQ